MTTLAMLGKVAITITFTNVYVFTAELFPTPVRHLAVGSSSMMARISGLASPYMGKPMVRGSSHKFFLRRVCVVVLLV